MKIHKLKLTTCEVPVKVEFVSSNYFAITFPKHFLPFDYSMGTDDEITVYADVYPDWTITVGKHSNEDEDVFEHLMDNEGLVEGIRHLLFRGDLSARGGEK
tara:strand:+ start:331 stop:633 length:303 start_codon:yes stop_codon:yes gene_type:complete